MRHPREIIRLRTILAAARHRGQASADPRGAIKFIGEYLSLNFTPRERFDAIAHHYRFLETHVHDVAIDDGVTLWRSIDDTLRCHDLVLQPSWMAPMEGEVELCFRLDGERLFTLTFSIIDGSVIGHAGPAIFVGAVQGAYFGRDRIRYAARQNDEIAPLAMLMLGVNAVADAFGITTIVGPSNAVQVASLKAVDGRSSSTDYDALWQREGGRRNDRGHFLIPVDVPTAVEDEVAGKHRARTRRRRLKRIEIRRAMVRNVAAAIGIAWRDAPVDEAVAIDSGSGSGRAEPSASPARAMVRDDHDRPTPPAIIMAEPTMVHRIADTRRALEPQARTTTAYLLPLLYEAMALAAI